MDRQSPDSSPWELCDRLIDSIPEDAAVRDRRLGAHRSYVEADRGMGVCFTCKSGAGRLFGETPQMAFVANRPHAHRAARARKTAT